MFGIAVPLPFRQKKNYYKLLVFKKKFNIIKNKF